MRKTIIQIYEIQTPEEARSVISLGVDYVGSVITSQDARHDPQLRETVRLVRRRGAMSSLIPLYTDPNAVYDTLDDVRPDIVHFCDRLDVSDTEAIEAALDLQASVKRNFPDIRITRSIPIGRHADTTRTAILALAARLEPLSDYFLTDTVLEANPGEIDGEQPVAGFVGITGLTCDWSVAAQLVDQSRIPVILAGGISPENVAEGIRRVRPFGVDSCTCTNAVDENGRPIRFRKNLSRVEALVTRVRRAERDGIRYAACGNAARHRID